MLDIVAACIVLYNICIINNKCIEEDWIIEAKNKLSRRIIEGEVRESSELRGEIVGIAEVRRKILAMEVPIADEENNEEPNLFLLREMRRLMTFCGMLQRCTKHWQKVVAIQTMA